jgi:CheY-like chemotaxis protein
VLVVDDNPTNRRIVVLQAQTWGMTATEAATAAEALNIIRQGQPFDLAILDMHMPDIDGLALFIWPNDCHCASSSPKTMQSIKNWRC